MNQSYTDGSTILIVDDTLPTLDLLLTHLSRCGFKVLVAQDGMRAIEQAECAEPDLILLDVMMPGFDGFETCRSLKESDVTRDIPVIFMTSLSDIDHILMGFEVGAVDYITKPVDYREVEVRVRAHLATRHLHQDLRAELAERESPFGRIS